MTSIDIQKTISNNSSINSIKSPKLASRSQTLNSSPISLANDIKFKKIINLYNKFISDNDHLGLATLARQYGIPGNLRYKVWPILLKYHPYVIDPFIDATVENDNDLNLDLKKLNYDINKYFKIRTLSNDVNSSPNNLQFSPIELEIIKIINDSIVKFFGKWGKIVKYDSGFTWIALNLAEWFPPIPNSNYVLIGKNIINKNNSTNKHLTQIFELNEFSLDENSVQNSFETSMSFYEVFERLVLVLLHSNDDDDDDDDENELNLKNQPINKREIIFKSGKIEKRINFFINALAKLQPELFKLLSEEEYLLSNNKSNNEWLTWWLKYCGSKILNKNDRGRLWDLLLGFRLNYKKFLINSDPNSKKLKIFKKFYNDEIFKDNELFNIDEFWFITSNNSNDLKWSQIDYQFQLIFIFISILHKNESKLLEIDQSEMIEFLSNLNFKENNSSLNNNINEFNFDLNGSIQKAIIEAGDLWRNWLWQELHDEINEN